MPIIFTLISKNQLVLLSGIFVLLATATIATVYNVQTVEGQLGPFISEGATSGNGNPNNPANGNGVIGNNEDHLRNGEFGEGTSHVAKLLAPGQP